MEYREGIKKLKELRDFIKSKYSNTDDVCKDLDKIEDLLQTSRNELCLLCGKYKNEHIGWCESCRWK